MSWSSPNPPDLNPIENLWALMKQNIYELYPELEHAPNPEAFRILLVQAAQEVWHAIEDSMLVCQRVCLTAYIVIHATGWNTNYQNRQYIRQYIVAIKWSRFKLLSWYCYHFQRHCNIF